MNDYDDRQYDDRSPADDRPPADPRLARSRTAAPGMILIILGLFGLLVSLGVVGLVHNLSVFKNMLKEAEAKEPPGPQKERLNGQIDQMEQADTPEVRTINTLIYGGAGAVSLLIVVGGVLMRSLSVYPLALATAVLAVIPYNGCLILTTPFGIWAVITLLNPEVRAAFGTRRAPREEY